MSAFEIVNDVKKGYALIHIKAGLLPDECNCTIRLDYKQAVEFHAKLGEWIKEYARHFGEN